MRKKPTNTAEEEEHLSADTAPAPSSDTPPAPSVEIAPAAPVPVTTDPVTEPAAAAQAKAQNSEIQPVVDVPAHKEKVN